MPHISSCMQVKSLTLLLGLLNILSSLVGYHCSDHAGHARRGPHLHSAHVDKEPSSATCMKLPHVCSIACGGNGQRGRPSQEQVMVMHGAGAAEFRGWKAGGPILATVPAEPSARRVWQAPATSGGDAVLLLLDSLLCAERHPVCFWPKFCPWTPSAVPCWGRWVDAQSPSTIKGSSAPFSPFPVPKQSM